MARAAVVLLVLWLVTMAASGRPSSLTSAWGSGAPTVAPRWHVAGEGRGVPAISGSTAYFLTKRHEVVSVDTKTGAVLWRRATGEPGAETLGSSIVVSNNVVMAGDYAVLGFDATSGAPKWRFEPANGYGAGLYLGEARDGVAFAGSPAGSLYGWEVSSGRLLWSAKPEIDATAESSPVTVFQPIVSGDVVVAGYSRFGDRVSGGVMVVDRARGRVRWRREFPRESVGAPTGFGGGPVVSGDVIVASSGDGRIFGFDCDSGDVRWVLPRVVRADGRRQDRDWRALAITGSRLITGSVSGVVTAFDVDTLREKWRFVHPDGGSIALQLAADDESAYVPHLGGLLVAVDVRDGRQRWQIGGFSDGFNWAPAIAGGNVYAAASRTGLFALPR
jgi:outer membrane protein assembly factor BamB